MNAPAPHHAPLPNWPGLMRRDLACAYLQLSERSFRLLSRRHGLQPVDCAGLTVRLYRKADLDRLIDNLPALGAQIDAPTSVANDAPPHQGAEDLAADALKKAARRGRR